MKKLMLLLCSFLFVLAVSAKAQEVEEAKAVAAKAVAAEEMAVAEEAALEAAPAEEAVKAAPVMDYKEVEFAGSLLDKREIMGFVALNDQEAIPEVTYAYKVKEAEKQALKEDDFDFDDLKVSEDEANEKQVMFKIGEPMKQGSATPLLCNWFKARNIKAGPGAASTCAEAGVELELADGAADFAKTKVARANAMDMVMNMKLEKFAEGMEEYKHAIRRLTKKEGDFFIRFAELAESSAAELTKKFEVE
ncbi:MAG: hypothetical protein J6V32_04575 [Elusimicrobiaceae bacterium]|nr:hypothetical protein [Elusimicrobiaceae bacterium]